MCGFFVFGLFRVYVYVINVEIFTLSVSATKFIDAQSAILWSETNKNTNYDRLMAEGTIFNSHIFRVHRNPLSMNFKILSDNIERVN